MGFGRLPPLLIQTLNDLLSARPRILKVDTASMTLVDNQDGSLTIGSTGGGGDVATDAIWDAKGDLAVGTGANTAAKLAVGSDGDVLTADSTQTTGTKWAAGSGGGALPMDITMANDTGGTVTKGTVVEWGDFVNASGVPELSVAGNSVPSVHAQLGIVLADIADTATGSVRVMGEVTGLDTHLFSASDDVGAGAAGSLAAWPGSAPGWLGMVTVSDATVGKIWLGGFIRESPTYHDHTSNSQGGGVLAAPLFGETTGVSTPGSGNQKLYIDSTTHHLTRKNSGGSVVDIETLGGTPAVATDAIWDVKGDLAVGTGADTAARLAVGTNDFVLTADSTQTTGLKWAAGGSGTVTSVAATVPTGFSVSGTPVTTAGTLAVTLDSQTANKVLASATTGGSATPGFRALVAADIPAIAEGGVTNLTTDLAAKAPVASPTFTGITTAPEFSASGLTGAVSASRYVGATTSGAPVSGTFVLGDWIAAQDGKRWTCTVGGTPGTWVQEPGTGGGGNVATDAIWDAKGDLAAGTGADTAAKLTVGADDTILMADAAASTGLKWVASQTPSTQAFGDSAAQGSADTYARGDHKHAMPAAPTTVATDVIFDAKGDLAVGTGADTSAKLTVGTNAFVLTADSTQTTGVKWAAVSGSGNVTSTGAQGSEPGSPASGDLYLPNDAPFIERYSGSAWTRWGPTFPLTTPTDPGTWVNQSSATLTTDVGCILFTSTGTTANNLAMRVMTAPATPYTWTVAFQPTMAVNASAEIGICFRSSGDSAVSYVSYAPASGFFNFYKWTNSTAFSAAYGTVDIRTIQLAPMLFFRIADNGTNRSMSISPNGLDWVTHVDVLRTDFHTPDQIGLVIRTAANPIIMRVLSIKQA